MRNLNFLRKSERKSVGTTLALTVGSPSAHRRYSALKHLAFMLLFLLGSLNVWGAEETYTFTDVSTPTTATTDGFTFTFDKGSGSTAPAWNAGSSEARLYAKGSLTIDGGENTITSIVFTYVVNKNKSGKAPTISSVSGTSNSGTWVESSKTWSDATGDNVIVFSTSGEAGNIGFKSVTITYSTGGGGKTDVTDEQLSWSAASATVTYGDEPYSLPSLTNTIPVSVSYQSTDETVATISNTGVVSILKAGSTTIKAVYAGSETLNAKTVQYTLTVNKAAPTPIVGGIQDVLDYSWHGKTSTTYGDVTAKTANNTGHSTAKYAANCAGGNTSIQLRSTNNSGFISTISAGYVKRVEIEWNDNTAAGRTLDIYGSNTAYTATSNLYNNATDGDLLGSLNIDDEETVLDFTDWTGDYKYIGFRSKSGAMFINSVTITWVPLPTYEVNLSSTGCTLNVQKGSTPVADNDKFEEGTQLTVSYSASEGYENAELVVKKTSDMLDVTSSVLSGSTLTMPAYGITIEATATKKQYTVTLAATNGKIQVGDEDKTSIVVAHGETAELTAVPNTTDFAFNGWTSSDGTKVALSGANDNPVTITVTGAATVTASFISSALDDPELSWSSNTATVVKGQTPYSLPSLTNEHGLTIAYESSNTSVAEIAANGAVTIKGVGEATITASNEEEGGYAESSKSYTLTVKGRVTWHIIKDGVDATTYADYVKDAVPTKPTGDFIASCHSSISLVGWTTSEYAKSDNAPATLYTNDVPEVTDNADYYAVWGVSSADSEASISEGVNTGGIINESGWTNSGAGSYASSGHGLKFDTQGDYITSPNISSENLKSVVVKFKAGYNSSQNSGSIFTIYSYDSDDNVLDSKTCEPETDYNDQNDYSYTLSGSATIAYVKIALTTRVANVGMEYAELFKIIPGSTTGYTTNCVGPVVVTDPEFDVATGTYYEVKTVRISNHDDDYLYFYTLDGTDPAADSNLDPTGTSVAYNHTTGIAINESCTLKAIAYDIDGNHSEVVSAEYVINLPLTTIQGIFDEATAIGGTAQERVITFNNWVVSGVKDATAYVTDGTKGFIIYTTSEGYHGLAVNDKISGTVTCQLKLFSQAAEVVGLTKSDITTAGGSVTNDGVVTPVSKAISELSGVNTGAPVIISNVTYNSTNSTLVDEDANAIKPYTTLYNYGSTFVNNKIYSVTGIYLQYGNTKELLPRKSEDIVLESKEQPTLKWYVNNNKEIEIGATYTINADAEFAPYFESNSEGAKTYSSTVGTVASIDPSTGALSIEGVGETVISCAVEADGDYLAGSKSFTLKVRAAGSGDATWVAATWASDNSIAANSKMNVQSPIAIDANLSMTWSKAEGSNDPIYHSDGEGRLYQKNTLTITASNSKQITRIEFHFTGNNTGSISANEGTYSNGVWTGFAPSVTFTNANGASGARIQSIDIEYAQGTTTTLEISDIVLLNTDGETAISFTSNKPEAVVTYSDYDDEVITIADGKVTPVAIGNTSVKASIAAEAPYSSVSITFNVRVKSSSETVENVVILSQFGEGWIAMKHDFTAVEVEKAADGTIIDLTCDEEDITWVMTADGASAMFQQPGTNKYLAVGSSNALVLSDEATVWTLSDDGYYWNVSGRTFLYQGNGGKYKNYSASNAGADKDGGYSEYATFIVPVFATRDVLRGELTEGKWGTYCPDHDVKYPAGASFYTLTYKEEVAGQPYKVFFDEVEPGATLVGGKPYLFIAEGEAIKGIKVGDAASLQNYNGFTGVLSDYILNVAASESAAYTYYIVYGNEIRLCGAGQFNVPAERAYLNMSQMSSTPVAQAPGRRRISLVNHAVETATGIENAETNEAPRKVLINGELYIIRGEKMYDAKGQLVK